MKRGIRTQIELSPELKRKILKVAGENMRSMQRQIEWDVSKIYEKVEVETEWDENSPPCS